MRMESRRANTHHTTIDQQQANQLHKPRNSEEEAPEPLAPFVAVLNQHRQVVVEAQANVCSNFCQNVMPTIRTSFMLSTSG
jgi:hypothetical protein